MVPAPRILHSPTVFATIRQEEVRAASATSLELALITAALFVSSVLSFFNTKRPTLARQPRNPAYSNFVMAIAICFTLGAFSVAIATLALGWLRVISLDAVAGIVFALGPAFFSIPREILTYSRDSVTSRLMWDQISLNIPTTHFQYVRLMRAGDTQDGQLCFVEHSKPDTTVEDKSKLREFEGRNLIFIRNMLNSSRHSACYSLFNKLWNCFKYTKSNDRARYESRLRQLTKGQRLSTAKLQTVKGIHVYGIPIEEFLNFAFVRDIDDGITSWWWSGVSSARHLIARPHRVHLESGRRVGNALALLSDIISIGDLILHFHLDVLEWMLQKDHDIRSAVTSASGLTCKRFIRELELDGWDTIGPEDLLPLSPKERIVASTEDSSNTENSHEIENLDKTKISDACLSQTSFSISPSKHYALLFLILTEKSRRFLLPTADEEGKMPSGQYVLDELWRAKEKNDFRKIALKSVGKWLQGWGLEIACVQKTKDGTLTSFDQKDRQSNSIS